MPLLAAALSGAATARADETTELEALLNQAVVSTASRATQVGSVAPATSVTITAEDLRRYGIRSLDEAIDFLSLGMVTQNPLHSVDIGARGVLLTADFGDHVLLLVNGHAMNEPWGGTAYFERGAAIPMELIDHLEVILGPGSVLYGSHAMLGVINIITKRAKDYRGAHVVVEGELATSLKVGTGFGVEFRLFGKPAEATFQAEYYTQRGPTFTFGPQPDGLDSVTGKPVRLSGIGPGTGIWGGAVTDAYYTRVPAAYARILVGDFELNVRAASYKRATPYPNLFNVIGGDFNEPGTYELDRWISLDAKYAAALSPWIKLTARLYGDLYDYDQPVVSHAADDCVDGSLAGCLRRLRATSRWAGLEPGVTLDWLRDGSLVTMVGADARLRDVSSRVAYTDLRPGAKTVTYGAYDRVVRSMGVFTENTFHPTSWLYFNGGARLDVDERFGTKVSPRAALAVVPWKDGTLKAIYSEAFRGPNSFEASYADPGFQVAAQNLRPESVRSVEGSLEQRFGGHRALLSFFRSWWSDMVVLEQLTAAELDAAKAAGQLAAGTGNATQYRNAGSIDNYGFGVTLEGSAAARRLHYGFNLTGAYARRSFTDGRPSQPLPVAPQVFGNARLAYDLPRGLPTVALAAQFLGARPADRAFDGGFTPTPYAPPQLLLRATVSGAMPRVPGLSYRLGAQYSFADRSAYVAGPIQAATPLRSWAELAPVDRFRANVGLSYDLPF
jgi:outer membrane receptor protein involved in Fe transport